MKIILTCGGTGGHIYPAVALANMIKARHCEAEILFIGAENGMETRIVPKEGYEIETIRISSFMRGLRPKALAHNLKTVARLAGSVRAARALIERTKPDAVVGTGGYASFPVIYAASRLGIPTAIHESNVQPGLTTRMLAGRADRVMVSFAESAGQYPKPERVVVTGTPVRESFIYTKKQEARRKLRLDDRPLILSSWGSLGAREMNKKIAAFIKAEIAEDKYQHIHATGSYGYRWMPEYIANMGVDLKRHPNIDLREYIYNMPDVMAAADLVICRAGASTMSELTAQAKPAIIVPSPNVAENHQEKNARLLERKGAAVVMLEKDLTGERLFKIARELLGDPERMQSMSRALSEMALLDACSRIYDTVMALVRK